MRTTEPVLQRTGGRTKQAALVSSSCSKGGTETDFTSVTFKFHQRSTECHHRDLCQQTHQNGPKSSLITLEMGGQGSPCWQKGAGLACGRDGLQQLPDVVCPPRPTMDQFDGLTAAETVRRVSALLGCSPASSDVAEYLDHHDELKHFREKFLVPKMADLPSGESRA